MAEGFNVGSVHAQLAFDLDDRGAERFERQLNEARAKAAKPVVAHARMEVDEQGFRKFKREVSDATSEFNKFAGAGSRLFQLFKGASFIAAIGVAAQGLSALGAAAGAAAGALAPLTGALAAYPALGSAAAQGVGVMTLATKGLGDALGAASEAAKGAHRDAFLSFRGGSEEAKKYREELKKLTPAQQEFVRALVTQIDEVKKFQQTAAQGFLPGATRGIEAAFRNLPVLRRNVRDTAEVLGDLAEQAGKLAGSRGFGRDLETQMNRNETTIRRLGQAGLALGGALRHVVLAAGPLVEWMTRGALAFARLTERQAESARETGKLASFFDDTRRTMSRVIRIAGDLAVAFFNITKAGKPLGDEILVSLVRSADAFREWTESARGENAIKKYFQDARPAIFELGRLIRDATKAFFQLGRGDQVAPLLRIIRTELVPAFTKMIEGTTKDFAPAMIRLATELIKLFTHLAGSSGPLVAFTEILGRLLSGFNKLLDAVPALNTALVTLAGGAGIYKALQIGAAITGITRLRRLISGIRTEGIGGILKGGDKGASSLTGKGATPANPLFVHDVSGGIGAGKGRAPTVVGAPTSTAGRVAAGARSAAGTALRGIPVVGTGVAAVELAGSAGLFGKGAEAFEELANRIGDLATPTNNLRKFGLALDKAIKSGDRNAIKGIAEDLRRVGRATEGVSGKQIRDLADEVSKVARGGSIKGFERLVRDTNRDVSRSYKSLAKDADRSLDDIRKTVARNGTAIKQRLGSDTEEGKDALGRNFQQAVRIIRSTMGSSRKETERGTREIRRLMKEQLALYGFTGRQADRYISGQDPLTGKSDDSSSGAGKQRGGWLRRAVGGWIGSQGMVSDDVVPIAPGVLAAYGEYDANGPGGRRAVINRHQTPVVEMALAMGGYPGLNGLPPGGQLPIIERAMDALGGLDRLFAMVNRPHMLQAGGRINLMGAMPGLAVYANAAKRFGLSVTSGRFGRENSITSSGGRSHHSTGSALDLGGAASGMLAFAKHAAQTWGSRLEELIHTPLGFGIKNGKRVPPYAAADHFDHVHIADTDPRGAIGGGAVDAGIRRVRVRGLSGAVQGIAQGAVDAVRRGANARLDQIVNAAGPSVAGLSTAGAGRGHLNKGQLASLWRRVNRGRGNPNLMAAIALAESSGDPAAHGPPDGRGLWQIEWPIWSKTLGRFGNPYHPEPNARMAGEVLRQQGLGAWVVYKTGAYRQFLQRGGRVGSTGKGTNLLIRGLRKIQGTRIEDFENYQEGVERERKSYEQADRRYNQSDEILIDEQTGEVNESAVQKRVKELMDLEMRRRNILRFLRQMLKIARRVVRTYKEIIGRLTRSLRHAPRKERGGVRESIEHYQEQLGQWQQTVKDLPFDVEDARLDITDIVNERAEVAGTKARPPEAAEEPTAQEEAVEQTVGLTPDQEAQVARAQEIIRGGALTQIAEAVTRYITSNAQDLGFASPYGGTRYGDPNVTHTPAGQGSPFGGYVINQTINTLVPSDSATYAAVANAAVTGIGQQGARRSVRSYSGI